ncbi:MAG TPA: hypothetical protein DEB35_01850, partial [Desulfuromonas sp.]|nr:hypothetical protein [Desulfuromonas sp.]
MTTARQNSFRLAFPGLFLLLLIAAVPVRPAQAAATLLETIGNLGTKAHLELRQSPLTVMKATPFTLRTTPVLPPAAAVRDILCDLTMPAMPMPLNRPRG